MKKHIAFLAAGLLFVLPALAETNPYYEIKKGTLPDEAHVILDDLIVSLVDDWEEEIEIEIEIEYEEGVLEKEKIEKEGSLSDAEEALLADLVAEIETASEDVELKIKVENDPPVAKDQDASVLVGESVTITLEATDANNHPLTYTIESEPESGDLSELEVATTTYTPDGTRKTDSFAFTANDGFDDSEAATVRITVVFPAPSAFPPAGTYTSIQSIALTTASTSAPHSIHYTLDGTAPDCASLGTLYTEPISIFSSKTLNAIACYENDIVSAAGSLAYVIEKLDYAPGDLPLLLAKNIFVPTEAATSTPVVVQVVQKVVLNVSGTNGTSTVVLPKDVVISRVDGENLDATLLTSSTTEAGSLSGLGSGTMVKAALQWGIPDFGLEFSKPVVIRIFVGADLDGKTLEILRSTNRESGWTNDGIVAPATCVVADGVCAFEATKASYYAATETVPPPPPPSRSTPGRGRSSEYLALVPPLEQPAEPKQTDESPEPEPELKPTIPVVAEPGKEEATLAARYEVIPAPPVPPVLAALESVFGTSALNFGLVALAALFGAVFYALYDLARSRIYLTLRR